MTAALVAAVLLPAAGGVALLLAGRRADPVAGPGGVVVAALVLVLAVLAATGRGTVAAPFLETGPIGLGLVGLSAVVLIAVAAVALPVLVFAAVERQQPAARFTGLMLLFVAAVVLTVGATTLPALLAGWEVMGATSALLIGVRLEDAEAVDGGLVAFLTTRSADLGLYLAAGAAVAGGAGLGLDDLARAGGGWRDVIAAGVLVAALGKAAQLPFSFWLSRAMLGPSAVSALLHSAAMVAMGGFLLLRLQPLLAAVPWAGPTTAWIGAATAVVLGLVALAQRDLKQLLAASTAAQLGFVVLAAGAGSIAGGAAQLLAHAATKAALFLVAGAWLGAWGVRRLDLLRGAGRSDRASGVLATVAAASLAGLPPLSIWAAKDLLLAPAGPALTVVALVAAVIAAGYSARIARTVWAVPTASEGERSRVPGGLLVPVAVLLVAAVALGAIALPPVERALAQAVGDPGAPSPAAPLQAVSAVLALAVFVAVLRLEPPAAPGALHWFALERLARIVVVRPVLALSAAADRLDGRLEAATTGLGRGVVTVSGASAAADDRLATAVRRPGVLALADAAARLDAVGPGGLLRGTAALAGGAGRLVQRVQSGAVFQYYAVAALAAVALIVLVVVVR